MVQTNALRVTLKWCEGIVHRIQGSAAPAGDSDAATSVGDAHGAMATLVELGDLHRARSGPGKSFHLSELLQIMPLKSIGGFWEGVEAVAFPVLDEMSFLPDDVNETLEEEEEEEEEDEGEEDDKEQGAERGDDAAKEGENNDQHDDFLAINESAALRSSSRRGKQRANRTARNVARFAHVRPLKAVTTAAMLVCAELELVASDRAKERARGRARRKAAAAAAAAAGTGNGTGVAGSSANKVSRASHLPPAFFDLCVSLHDVLMATAQARSQAAAAAAAGAAATGVDEEDEGAEDEEGRRQDFAFLSRLYSSTLRLCERLWTLDLDRREECVPQLLPLLLLDASRNFDGDGDDDDDDEDGGGGGGGGSSLEARAERALKRCYAVRRALCLFDWEDESSEDLVALLLRCFVHPRLLSSTEGEESVGQRFLGFCMGSLHPSLATRAHAAMRSLMAPPCPRRLLRGIGEVYFRAWKCAYSAVQDINGGGGGGGLDSSSLANASLLLLRLEQDCIQQLMSSAALASTAKLAGNVRAVLDAAFHSQRKKRQRGA